MAWYVKNGGSSEYYVCDNPEYGSCTYLFPNGKTSRNWDMHNGYFPSKKEAELAVLKKEGKIPVKNNFVVFVSNETVSRLVQETAFAAGYSWSGDIKYPQYLTQEALHFYSEKNKSIGFSSARYAKSNYKDIITLEEFFELMRLTGPSKIAFRDVKIGSYIQLTPKCVLMKIENTIKSNVVYIECNGVPSGVLGAMSMNEMVEVVQYEIRRKA